MPILSRKGLQLPVVIGVAALLNGCVLFEHFDADIVMTGYRYEATLKGKVAEPCTIATLTRRLALSPSHDAQMKAQESRALAVPGMTRFAYMGEGRYHFAMKLDGELSESTPVVGFPNTKGGSNNFLTIHREIDGTVVISSPEVPPKTLVELKEVGLEASGTITIKFEGKVLVSNVNNQPAEGVHIWSRKTWQDRVFFKFYPNAS